MYCPFHAESVERLIPIKQRVSFNRYLKDGPEVLV